MSQENNTITAPAQKHLLRSDTFEVLARDFGRPFAIFATLFYHDNAELPADFWAECTESELLDICSVCDWNNKRSGILKGNAFDELVARGKMTAERFGKLFNQAKSFEEKFWLLRELPAVRKSWEGKSKK